jgi:hypothetical protein
MKFNAPGSPQAYLGDSAYAHVNSRSSMLCAPKAASSLVAIMKDAG